MNMPNPLVSVIVLTYNHKPYIAQALDSILMQEVDFSYEILVGDDGSQDGTSEIVWDYAQRYPERIRAFIREKNLGPSLNLYETMRRARGKYMASCEGDDYWSDSRKLQLQVDFLEANPQYIGCVHPIQIVDENNVPLKAQKLQWLSTSSEHTFSLSSFRGVVVPGHGVSMVKRNLFLEDGFCGELIYQADRNIADRTIALLWLEHGDFYKMDRTMACYRKASRGNNLTRKLYKNNPSKILMDYEYTLRLEEYARSHGLNAGFQFHKEELFVKAVLIFLLHPSGDNYSIVARILRESGHPFQFCRDFLPTAVRLLRRSV